MAALNYYTQVRCQGYARIYLLIFIHDSNLQKKTFYRPQTKFAEVLFLQMSVYPQGGVRGKGRVCGKGVCMAKGAGMAGEVCMAGAHVWQLGGACVAGEMATAAGGTHPTGMHSCLCEVLMRFQLSFSKRLSYLFSARSFV